MQRNGLQCSDGVLESTIWEVTVRASFDVCLRRNIGAGGELHPGSRGTGRREGLLRMRFKALEEWTEEVGLGKRQPEVRGQRRGGGWGGDLALHSQMSPNVTTISWARAAPSHPAGVQGSPLDFPTSASHIWGPPSQPRLLAALALLLSLKPARRSSLSDISTSELSYGFMGLKNHELFFLTLLSL